MKSWGVIIAIGGTLFARVSLADPNPAARNQLAITAVEQKADLDAATAARVEQVVDRYREPLKAARAERHESARLLRLALKRGRSDDRVRAIEGRLAQASARMQQAETDRMRDLGKVLTPTQLGRLMLSWRAINHSLRHGRV